MENTQVEQPDQTMANVNEQIIDESKGEIEKSSSTFGKFKDATSLYSAYESLEKEFTRKSQKLAEVTKEVETLKKTQNSQEKSENILLKSTIEQDFDQNKNNLAPKYTLENWREKVLFYMHSHPDAKEVSGEMAKLLISDKNLASLDNCLDYAYFMAKGKTYKPADLNDSKTLSTFASDERIKEKVIKEYLSSIKNSKSNLRLIGGEAKDIILAPTKDKPKNLKEASIFLKNLLQM